MKALGRGSIASYLEIALNVIGVVLWVSFGAVILGSVVYVAVLALISAGVLPETIIESGRGHINSPGVDAEFTMDSSMAWQLVLPALLSALIAITGGLIIVRRLKKLFASFRSAEPFRKENATHLRVIWMTMIGIELSRYVLMAVTGGLIAAFGEPAGTDWEFKVNINLMTWAAILVLIVLAEVFREGARLREEQELTI